MNQEYLDEIERLRRIREAQLNENRPARVTRSIVRKAKKNLNPDPQ